MTWKPSEDVDRVIRQWMKAKGWEVNRTNYDFDREVYAWRHQQRDGKSPTLRIFRYVLEHYPAFIVLHHLEELKVAQVIRARPEARMVVVQNGERGRARGTFRVVALISTDLYLRSTHSHPLEMPRGSCGRIARAPRGINNQCTRPPASRC
jgi:hypothetical protein